GQVASESTKRLGPSAYLVNVLPSIVLVSTVFGLASSRLYPWAHPLHDGKGGMLVSPGLDSIAHAVQQLKVTEVVILVFVMLLTAIVLRPFQVAAVQFLEGYWRHGVFERLAVELHARRLTTCLFRSRMADELPDSAEFAAVATASRRTRRIDQVKLRAERVA